jgi:hypothetical protein
MPPTTKPCGAAAFGAPERVASEPQASDEKRAAVMQAVGEEPLAAIDTAEQAQQQSQQQKKEGVPPDNKSEPDPELAATQAAVAAGTPMGPLN